MAEDKRMRAALNVMRRMPPSNTENSLAGLVELVPELQDDLLNHVDQPLKLQRCESTGRDFIVCDYNRDGDSFRSPWSNEYYPPVDDGFLPTPKLRKMEVEANTIFDAYRKLYFDTGHSSVYFFNTDEEDENFGACFLVHKDVDGVNNLTGGVWDSIHVFDVKRLQDQMYDYKLTTTVMVSMDVQSDHVGKVDLSGAMTQTAQTKETLSDKHPHIDSMGRMLESMELKIRNAIEGIYIQKTREVINGMRYPGVSRDAQWAAISKSLNEAVLTHRRE